MKRHLSIGFMLGLALLAACARPDDDPVETRHGTSLQTVASPKLQAIDSLMWQRPDSALAVLMEYLSDDGRDGACTVSNDIHCDTVGDGACTVSTDETFDNHYANLLLAELLYKNYCAQTNRAELQQAVSYFDSLTSTLNDHPHASWRHGGLEPPSPKRNDNLIFLDARAHYINGVGYYEHDSMVEACKEYLKALEVMEEQFEEKELIGKKAKFMTYTYNRLGDMFSEQFMMEPAIECFKKSYEFCKIEPISPYSVSNALYRIGLQYNMLKEKDNANHYYECAIRSIPDTNNLLYRDLESSRALLSYQMRQHADSSLKTLFKMVQFADDEEERMSRFFTIGSIYFEEKMHDSALRYLEPVFRNTNDVVMRIQAADFIRIIYDNKETCEDSDEYVRFSAINKKSNGQNNAEVLQLSKQFKEYEDKALERQTADAKTKERKKTMARTIEIVVTFSFAITMLVVFLIRKRNQNLSEKEALAQHLQNANARLQAENEQLVRQHIKVQRLELHKAPVSSYEALMKEAVCFDLRHRFNRTEIITTNKSSFYADLAISAIDKQALARAVERHCPDFGPLLKSQCPGFTRNDFELCRFLLIGLSEPQVAVLLQKDYSTIWKRTKDIKKALQTAELEHSLRHILFEDAPKE